MKTIDIDDTDAKNRDNLGDNRDADGESGKETNNEEAGDSGGDESGTSLYCFHSHSDAKSSAQLLFHRVVLSILLIFWRTRLPSQAVVADNPRLSNTNIQSIQVV